MSKFIILLCDLSWWMILLSWLLPLLIGYLIGRLTRNSNITEVNESYSRNTPFSNNLSNIDQKNSFRLNQRNLELEALLVECRKSNLELERKCKEIDENKFKSDSGIDLRQDNEVEKKYADKEEKTVIIPNVSSQSKTLNTSNESSSNLDYSIYKKLNNTNLQIFEGLGPKMESFLKDNHINNWDDLSRQDYGIIKQKLEVLDPKYRILDPSSWPIQAGMACNNQWDELIQYQKDLSESKSKEGTVVSEAKLEKILVKMGLLKRYAKDDLKAVEGIGPKIEKLLHDNGIRTWIELKNADVEVLKAILLKAGERYQLADPTTWPYQAGIANDGRWKELFDYQDTLKGGKIV